MHNIVTQSGKCRIPREILDEVRNGDWGIPCWVLRLSEPGFYTILLIELYTNSGYLSNSANRVRLTKHVSQKAKLEVRSRFSLWILFLVSLFIALTGLIVFFTQWVVKNPHEYRGDMIIVSIFLGFVWIWLFFGELRTKALKLQIVNGEIIVSSFLGLGPKKAYLFQEFDGFQTWLYTGGPEYEFLCLVKNGRKKIRVSQQYYKNYAELKKAIKKHVPYYKEKDLYRLLDILSIFNIFKW